MSILHIIKKKKKTSLSPDEIHYPFGRGKSRSKRKAKW